MSINQVQFQKGLSLDEFIESYGREALCREAVQKAKWPTGFQCPHCGNPVIVNSLVVIINAINVITKQA